MLLESDLLGLYVNNCKEWVEGEVRERGGVGEREYRLALYEANSSIVDIAILTYGPQHFVETDQSISLTM